MDKVMGDNVFCFTRIYMQKAFECIGKFLAMSMIHTYVLSYYRFWYCTMAHEEPGHWRSRYVFDKMHSILFIGGRTKPTKPDLVTKLV